MRKKVPDQSYVITDMKSHILNVASELMTTKGIKETSLKDISKSAGISQGTLYYYYSAKDDIIYDIAEANLSYITEDLLKFLEACPQASPPREILKSFMERILAEQTRGRLHMYLLNQIFTNDDLRQKFQNRYKIWTSFLENSIRDIIGERPQNKSMATLILAVLDGLLIQNSCNQEFSLDEIVDILVH